MQVIRVGWLVIRPSVAFLVEIAEAQGAHLSRPATNGNNYNRDYVWIYGLPRTKDARRWYGLLPSPVPVASPDAAYLHH